VTRRYGLRVLATIIALTPLVTIAFATTTCGMATFRPLRAVAVAAAAQSRIAWLRWRHSTVIIVVHGRWHWVVAEITFAFAEGMVTTTPFLYIAGGAARDKDVVHGA
jgi:hypothetical protein